MKLFAQKFTYSFVFLVVTSAIATAGDSTENIWEVSKSILSPGPEGSFDEVSVKDPSVVFYKGKWHVFYTARGNGDYTTGYVSAEQSNEGARQKAPPEE